MNDGMFALSDLQPIPCAAVCVCAHEFDIPNVLIVTVFVCVSRCLFVCVCYCDCLCARRVVVVLCRWIVGLCVCLVVCRCVSLCVCLCVVCLLVWLLVCVVVCIVGIVLVSLSALLLLTGLIGCLHAYVCAGF
jgi:hypothetical protein